MSETIGSGSGRPPRIAVYAGVFDPPTMAHLEIVESALRIFDASLSDDMRPRVRVTAHAGLTAPYAESLGACALVRGMRPYADADAEVALAFMNERLAPSLPTVLFLASARNVYLSSTFVREAAT